MNEITYEEEKEALILEITAIFTGCSNDVFPSLFHHKLCVDNTCYK